MEEYQISEFIFIIILVFFSNSGLNFIHSLRDSINLTIKPLFFRN